LFFFFLQRNTQFITTPYYSVSSSLNDVGEHEGANSSSEDQKVGMGRQGVGMEGEGQHGQREEGVREEEGEDEREITVER